MESPPLEPTTRWFVIRILRDAFTGEEPSKPTWIADMDWDANDGDGLVSITTDPSQAKVFHTNMQAYRFWQGQSRLRPLRDDGRPNRPLTAWTVEIGGLP